MSKYSNFIEGKNVAIVGPANYLLDLSIGDYIDSFDIVLRINRGLELIPAYSQKLGTRTDILYHCLLESPDNGGPIDINFYKKNNLKWFCTMPKTGYDGKVYPYRFPKNTKYLSLLKVLYNFNFHKVGSDILKEIQKEIKCKPNTGLISIIDILSFKPKKLFITGFSFYLDSFIEGYKAGCSRSEEIFSEQCFLSVRHNQFNQWNYLKRVYKENKNIILTDNILDKILQMETLDRDKFNNEII